MTLVHVRLRVVLLFPGEVGLGAKGALRGADGPGVGEVGEKRGGRVKRRRGVEVDETKVSNVERTREARRPPDGDAVPAAAAFTVARPAARQAAPARRGTAAARPPLGHPSLALILRPAVPSRPRPAICALCAFLVRRRIAFALGKARDLSAAVAARGRGRGVRARGACARRGSPALASRPPSAPPRPRPRRPSPAFLPSSPAHLGRDARLELEARVGLEDVVALRRAVCASEFDLIPVPSGITGHKSVRHGVHNAG